MVCRVGRDWRPHLRHSLVPKYTELVYNGPWFSPEREALQALITETR